MTDMLDWRPGTGYSSRNSDVLHDMRIRKAMEHKAEVAHSWAQLEAYEAIEDFDHKMGYYMRKLPGKGKGPKVRVHDARVAKEEEERTMGISKTAIPREPSPVQHYEYGAEPVAPHKHLNLAGLNRVRTAATSGGSPSRGGTGGWGGGSARRPTTSGFVTYRDGTAASSPSKGGFGVLGEGGDVAQRPGTCYDTARSVHIVTKRNYEPPNSARGRIEGVMREVRTSNIWTPHSMLDPIFMPVSLTQRVVTARSGESSSRRPSTSRSGKGGGSSRWEEGPGKAFVEKQRQTFQKAMARMDAKITKDALKLAGDLQRKRAVLLVRASNKREQAFMEAHERGEFYAKQKLKLERKDLGAAQKEWEEKELAKLALGRCERDVAAEAEEVHVDMDRFDRDMEKRREAARLKKEESMAMSMALGAGYGGGGGAGRRSPSF